MGVKVHRRRRYNYGPDKERGMVIPAPAAPPPNRDTAWQQMFKKHRREFQQIFKKQLANFWHGPREGFDSVRFTDFIIGEGATKPLPDFIKGKYGQRAFEIVSELIGVKDTPQ